MRSVLLRGTVRVLLSFQSEGNQVRWRINRPAGLFTKKRLEKTGLLDRRGEATPTESRFWAKAYVDPESKRRVNAQEVLVRLDVEKKELGVTYDNCTLGIELDKPVIVSREKSR